MSFLESKLTRQPPRQSFHPAGETPVDDYIPPRMHSFDYWQGFVNKSFHDLQRNTLGRCIKQCEYDLSFLYGRKVGDNDNAMINCGGDCGQRWGSQFTDAVKNAERVASNVFNSCLKENNNFDTESKEILQCKKEMFNAYLDTMLDAEENYLRRALEKYS